MRSLRLLAALSLGLTPMLTAAAAGTVPAFAGGGAGLTLTATMEGQDQRLLVGTRHLVTITVADTPGEADLRDVYVGLDDLDPHPLPIDCPAGADGHLSLEPGQSLSCTAVVTSEIGYRTLLAKATARVPGGGDLARSTPLHYTGFMPPPPPPPAAAHHAVLKGPGSTEPAAARPHPGLPAPPPPAPSASPSDPPNDPAEGSVAAARNCAAGSGDGCCSDGKAAMSADGSAHACCADGKTAPSAGGCCSDDKAGSGCSKPVAAVGERKNGGLAFTGMSAAMLATAGAIGLALITGGALLVRRMARR